MKNRTLLRTGVAGTIVAAVCCFTPLLVVLLGVLGVSAVTGYLDFVLFSVLAFFLGLTIYAVWRKQYGDQSSKQEGR